MKTQTTTQPGPRPRPRPDTLAEAREQWQAALAYYYDVTGRGGLDFPVFDAAESALREAEGWYQHFSRLASTGAWPPERPRPRPRPNTLAEARVQWRTAYTRHYDLAEHGLLDALFFDAEAALREADGWLAHFERLAASPPATGLRK